MRALKRLLSLALVLSIAGGGGVMKTVHAKDTKGRTRSVTIDGSKSNRKENMLYKGNGMVSGNNTSRLLIDYKEKQPEAYTQMLEYLFGDSGLKINHLKVEMGSDVNSSSGTEPSVKRYEDEPADVTRGAAYILAHDAKLVNPDLTLDMLWWSEPKWVTDSADVYSARYKWYKETLDAAYEKYGLVFDYVSATRNERAADDDWIKYLSKALKSEKDCPYDYSKIKIVAGEEVCTWNVADDMLEDEELLEAIDVIGSHYTSWSTDNAQKLAYEHGKEVWFSEACPPMEYAQGTYKYDSTKTGLSEINGMLDVANRFLTMYAGGRMTLYEYQPAVAAYYSGGTYSQKQLIRADEPWSGYYLLDPGFYMGLHFSQFYDKGWAFIEDACFGDGKAGGDGHAVVDATYTYMTACDTETGDYSVTMTNTTAEEITYEFNVKNLDKAASQVYVWETRGPDSGAYDENYFKKTDTLTPSEKDGSFTYSVTVKPYSLVTVSTLDVKEQEYKCGYESKVMPLPYADDFEYSDEFLAERGGAPLYTTDQGGAFEVAKKDGGKVLMQKITKDIKATEWGRTPKPVTCFGDDRWWNYSVSADVYLDTSDTHEENYAGIGMRYNLATAAESGYRLAIYENGKWELKLNREVLQEGTVEGFDPEKNNLRIEGEYENIKCYINDTLVCEITHKGTDNKGSAGRASLCSSFNNNCFDNVEIAPIGDESYITRYDNTDGVFEYSGEWEHNCMSSFSNFRRTASSGKEGSALTLKFKGTGFALTGDNGKNSAEVLVSIDGGEEKTVSTHQSSARGIVLDMHGLDDGEHTAVVTIKNGDMSVDAVEIYGRKTAAEQVPSDSISDVQEKKSSKALPIVLGCAGAAAIVGAAIAIKRRKKK
ncbi:MAG: glycosyl hydrolase family 59 [Ruminococcus sp.]|nr:glycosyl hydrolase family 59 [Ruminococcus sp.]